MSNTVKLKRSAVASKVPATTDLALGELALNTFDGNLFFKKATGQTESIITVATLAGTQTLTNKTLSSAVLTGTLTANGGVGTAGQVLMSTGSGVQWNTPNAGALSTLSDVNLATPKTQQVLTYNGTQWVNADSNAVVASAVFASSQYDMGQVTDNILSVTEDEGLVSGQTNNIYDLGVLSFTGIISLNNIDQSVKSDYLGYSIIFGF